MRLAMAIPLLLAAARLSAAEPVHLAGLWGGEHVSVRASESSVIVQSDCAHGKIKAPVILDTAGAFAASGYYNQPRTGMRMRLADIAPSDTTAKFRGTVRGNELLLVIQPTGRPEQHFRLKRDVQVKFVRCL